MVATFERDLVSTILERLQKPPALIQTIVGPRQVGKTTAARAVERRWEGPTRYAAADLPLPPGPEWIETQWQLARRDQRGEARALLILDEVQKVAGWSEVVKRLWDEDRASDARVEVILLGSSALLLAQGATESLAGRFFLHRCLHWTYRECRDAFGWDLDRWLFFGGYPGAEAMANEVEEGSWRAYVSDSLIETVLSRDVLAMQKVTKPTLLRHLFVLGAQHPAQVLSYNKMLGQLQDAGNTTTLAHYLRLLETAFLVSGLERFSGGRPRKRGSSPKLILWNNALVNALSLRAYEETRADAAWWGRLVENAVGAHLLGHLQGLPFDVAYYRHRNDEVDFVVSTPAKTWAIEVKSGRPNRPRGLDAFRRAHPEARSLLVGASGIPLEELFLADPADLLR